MYERGRARLLMFPGYMRFQLEPSQAKDRFPASATDREALYTRSLPDSRMHSTHVDSAKYWRTVYHSADNLFLLTRL